MTETLLFVLIVNLTAHSTILGTLIFFQPLGLDVIVAGPDSVTPEDRCAAFHGGSSTAFQRSSLAVRLALFVYIMQTPSRLGINFFPIYDLHSRSLERRYVSFNNQIGLFLWSFFN